MIRLLPYDQSFLPQVREWLEGEEFKEYFRRFPPSFTWLSSGTAPQAFSQSYFIEKDGALVGLCNLTNIDGQAKKAEVGVGVLLSAGKRSEVAVEAFRLLFDYAFNYLGLNKLYALPLTSRPEIRTLLLRWNFKHEGTLRDNVFYEGRFRDEDSYSLTRAEYLEIPEKDR